MAFIVSLFKYVILIGCFAILVAMALAIFAVVDPSSPLSGAATPYMLAGSAAGLLFLLLNLAGLALVISLHDRHREIAEGIDRVATALEQHTGSDRHGAMPGGN